MKPNMLLMDESLSSDHTTVALNPSKLDELGLNSGDTVMLRGNRRRETVVVVYPDDTCPVNKMRTTKVVRSNLR